ncbi:hypothetical protein ACOMHN_032334 [Nucella lapillus]
MAENKENKQLVAQKSFVQPKPKRKVQLRIVYIKIDDIRTVQEEFSGIVFIRARWREPTLDNNASASIGHVVFIALVLDVSSVNWATCWDPKLDMQNFKGESKANKWRELEFGPEGEVFVVEKRRVKGAFAEQMELAHFPFDLQDLSVLVTSELKEAEIELTEDEHDVSLVDLHAFADDQRVDGAQRNGDYGVHAVRPQQAGIYFKCCATRLAGFFVWNIMFIMSIISALGFVTFAVSRKLPQNRIQLSFILVLASVTFKFAASNSVPKISYLTHLDRYILGNMIFTFLIAVWHGIVTLWEDKSDFQADLDFWAFITFIIIYVILHIVFLLVTMFSDRAARLTGKTTTKTRKRLGGFRRGLAKVGFV